MTELEVLQKLERAYSRKWWQFWMEPSIPTRNIPLGVSVYKALSREYQLEYYSFHSITLHSRVMTLLSHPTYDRKERLKVIRTAIAKQKEQK